MVGGSCALLVALAPVKSPVIIAGLVQSVVLVTVRKVLLQGSKYNLCHSVIAMGGAV